MKFLLVVFLAALCLAVKASESDLNSADTVIEENATFPTAQFETDEYEDEYEYGDYEDESSEPDLHEPLPDHYKWLKEQIMSHLKSKDWESETKDILGTKEYGAHSRWLHNNHDKLVQQGSEEDSKEEAAPSGGSAEEPAPAPKKEEPVAPPEEQAELAPMLSLVEAEQVEKVEQAEEESEVPEVHVETKDLLAPESHHEESDEYDYGTSSAEQTLQKNKGTAVLEIDLSNDTMDEAEPGLEGAEEESEAFFEQVEALEDEDVRRYLTYKAQFAQHRAMVMTVLIMFFVLTLALFAFTCFRCMKLLTDNVPTAPGAYQRMQEDTESLCAGKA